MEHLSNEDEQAVTSLRAMFDAGEKRAAPRREALKKILAALPSRQPVPSPFIFRHPFASGISALMLAGALTLVITLTTAQPSSRAFRPSNAAPTAAATSDQAIADTLAMIDQELAGLQNDSDMANHIPAE